MAAVTFVLGNAGAFDPAHAHGQRLHIATTDCGTVETVREIAITDPVRDAFEHRVNREIAHELLIRTDDGSTVLVRQRDAQHFRVGQRVRLLPDGAVPHPDLP